MFRRTRKLLEELKDSDAEILICTKSDLVLRDLDLLRQMKKVTVSWSVNTPDETFFHEVKDICDLFWLENLNLRGGFKASIMDYIKSHYPHLIPLYEKIYLHKDRTYCKQLEQETAKWRRRLNASMWTIKIRTFSKRDLHPCVIFNWL